MEKLTIDQKFAKAYIDLERLRPFYSAVYSSIDKTEDTGIETIGVSSNEMVYNPEYIDSLEYEEFMFILLHELAHLILMHPTRAQGKDPSIFNVAADLIVNGLLAEEFGVYPGKLKIHSNIGIKMPIGALYNNRDINLDNDSTEELYMRLMNQASKNGYNKNGEGLFNLSDRDSNNNSRQDQNDGGDRRDRTEQEQAKPKGKTKMVGKDQVQIVNDNDQCDLHGGSEDFAEQEFKVRRMLSNAQTKYEMTAGSGKNAGDSSNKLQVFMRELLKSKLDWRKLLKKYCINLHSSDTSFSKPDKRMSYQSAIYPGTIDSSENALKDIKIAIDTSISIGEDDLKYILGQISDITKKYKTEAEMICWDTEVQSTYSIKDVFDIYKHGLCGRGGTRAESIFEYLDSKACKVKPKLTIVFTDGYFSLDNFNARWNKKYKDTIWVMTRDYNSNFKPPFGKIAIAKFID